MYAQKLFSRPNKLPQNEQLMDEVIYLLGGGDEPLSEKDLKENGYQTTGVIEMTLRNGNINIVETPLYLENMNWNKLLESKWFPVHGGTDYPQELAYKLSETGIGLLEEILKSKKNENTKFQMRCF